MIGGRLQGGLGVGEPNRKRIEAALQATPGLGFRALCRATGLAMGTVQHHLGVLRARGRVWCVWMFGASRHFVGRRPASRREFVEAVVVSFDAVDGRLYVVVRDEGPLCQSMIVERFSGVARSCVQHRLKRLVDLGVLESWREGRYRFYAVCAVL